MDHQNRRGVAHCAPLVGLIENWILRYRKTCRHEFAHAQRSVESSPVVKQDILLQSDSGYQIHHLILTTRTCKRNGPFFPVLAGGNA